MLKKKNDKKNALAFSLKKEHYSQMFYRVLWALRMVCLDRYPVMPQERSHKE